MRGAIVIFLLDLATQAYSTEAAGIDAAGAQDLLDNLVDKLAQRDFEARHGRDLEHTMLQKPRNLNIRAGIKCDPGIPFMQKTAYFDMARPQFVSGLTHQGKKLAKVRGTTRDVTPTVFLDVKVASASRQDTRSSEEFIDEKTSKRVQDESPKTFGGNKNALEAHFGKRYQLRKSDWWKPADNAEINRGGYAVVFRARDRDGRRVAIKQQPFNASREEDEAYIMKKIMKKGTVFALPLIESSVQDFYDRRKKANLTLQYLVQPEAQGFGGIIDTKYNLDDYLDEVKESLVSGRGTVVRRDEYLTGGNLRLVLAQLAVALRSLHRNGYVHYDVKAGNILLDGALEGWPTVPNIRLMDFGLAKPTRGIIGRVERVEIGTEGLKAPELWDDKEFATYSLDWWSYGVTAASLALGQRISFEQDISDGGSKKSLKEFVAEKLATAKQRTTGKGVAGIDKDLTDLLVNHLLVPAKQRPNSLGSIVAPFWKHSFWTWTDDSGDTQKVDWNEVRRAGRVERRRPGR